MLILFDSDFIHMMAPIAIIQLIFFITSIGTTAGFGTLNSGLVVSSSTGQTAIYQHQHQHQHHERKPNRISSAAYLQRGGKTALFAGSRGSDISSKYGGKTLSTKQVLKSDIYLDKSSLLSPDEEPVPLFVGLRNLVKSLESILLSSTSSESILLNHLDTTTILRIEQPISAVHSVDPLCWIHAQKRVVDNLRLSLQNADSTTSRNTNENGDGTLPVIYFSDAEGNVEAAAVGKASPAYSDSWDPFMGKRIWDDVNGNDGRVNGDDRRGTHQSVSHMFKEGELPRGARVYGGSRFDWQHYQSKMKHDSTGNGDSDDWDGFGGDRGGYWILPAVELRRETINTEQTSAKSVMLAVHLHNLSPSSLTHQTVLDQQHRHGWHDAASRVLMILRGFSAELSPAVPCTTLPPVITRSESTGKEGDGDSGLAFERGVTEALRQIQQSDNKDEDTASKLRKVVLARKVDLNLGSSVNGLDILMRMKYGGHIGHLFYLNPGDKMSQNRICTSNNSKGGLIREFIGCTPERLFRVNGAGNDRTVISEALAGTRIRGQTPSADNELLRELLSSKKDMLENQITGQFIRAALVELEENGWLEKSNDIVSSATSDSINGSNNSQGIGVEDIGSIHRQPQYFVRRLRHLQHICQTFEGKLSKSASVVGKLYGE